MGGQGELQSIPATAPKMIEPERFYEVFPVEADIDEGGQWTITLSDTTGARAVIPYYFAVFS
jgi:hypothetical protein